MIVLKTNEEEVVKNFHTENSRLLSKKTEIIHYKGFTGSRTPDIVENNATEYNEYGVVIIKDICTFAVGIGSKSKKAKTTCEVILVTALLTYEGVCYDNVKFVCAEPCTLSDSDEVVSNIPYGVEVYCTEYGTVSVKNVRYNNFKDMSIYEIAELLYYTK